MAALQGFIKWQDWEDEFFQDYLKPLVLQPHSFSVKMMDPGLDVTTEALLEAKKNLRFYIFNLHFGIQLAKNKSRYTNHFIAKLFIITDVCPFDPLILHRILSTFSWLTDATYA